MTALNQELSHFREFETLRRDRGEDGVTSALIDPFLNCLVFGRTPAYDAHNSKCLRPEPPPSHLGTYTVSQKFAFIPTDFLLSPDRHVTFLSYINNVNPRQTALYGALGSLLGPCTRLLENVLTDLHRNNPLSLRIKGSCKYTEWDEPEPPEHSDDEEGWSAYESEVRHWVIHRPLQLPDVPPNGYPGGLESRKHYVELCGRKLQVIINVWETRLVGVYHLIS